MTRASLITICLAGTGFCGMCVSGLSEPASRVNRRAFIHKIPIAFAAATTASVLQHRLLDCGCPSCNVAMAYERRDVGGDNPSQDMAAMNAQAYETMNRLERSGVKLDVSTENIFGGRISASSDFSLLFRLIGFANA